ncbi:MAG: hypothetical protein KC502_09120 [Myxococcales bacterium]|nr:hypothetical protein [Myxococcales bacterium]
MSRHAEGAPQRPPLAGAMVRGRACPVFAAFVLIFAPSIVLATPYGAGAVCVARGGQCSAQVPDTAAAFHNTAALSNAKPAVRLSTTGALHAMGAALRCTDCTAHRPPASRQTSLGWAGPVHPRVGLGVAMSVPAGELVAIGVRDRRQPHWPGLMGVAERFSFHAGVGARIFPWLRLGIGVQVHAQIASKVRLDLDLVNGVVDRADVEIHLGPSVGPTAAALVSLSDHLQLAATWRYQAAIGYQIPAHIVMDHVADAQLTLAQLAHGTPQTVDIALGYSDETVSLEAGFRVEFWGWLPGIGPDAASDVGGPLVDGVGLGRLADIDAPASAWAPTLQHTLSAGAAVSWRIRRQLTLHAGCRFKPSPFPVATADAALLDGDGLMAGGGAALKIGQWRVAVGGQVWHWLPRTPAAGPTARYDGVSLIGAVDLTRTF